MVFYKYIEHHYDKNIMVFYKYIYDKNHNGVL